MKDWKGGIIAEGLSDPAIINKLTVYGDYEGHTGRWHGYDVRCSREEIDALQPFILRGWYAHFWKQDKLIVVFNDKQFELARKDKGTWQPAIEHGKAQGIPEDELDFPTDEDD